MSVSDSVSECQTKFVVSVVFDVAVVVDAAAVAVIVASRILYRCNGPNKRREGMR